MLQTIPSESMTNLMVDEPKISELSKRWRVIGMMKPRGRQEKCEEFCRVLFRYPVHIASHLVYHELCEALRVSANVSLYAKYLL